MTLNEIRDTVVSQWHAFESCYSSVLHSTVPLLNTINSYQAEHGGKHLRPLLVLLTAEATHSANPHTAQLATIVELLHSASLMHDDVVDNDETRRGAPSIQHRWNIRVALLTGDYYLARMMQLLDEVGDPHATQITIATAAAMSEGEMMQQQQLMSPSTTADLETYLKIIDLKTARLIQTCCVLGTHGGSMESRQWMESFGHAYGMAFQIRDDLDDLNHEHLPWIPSKKVLQQALQQHCQQARETLRPLSQSVFTTALEQLVKNLEI